MMSICRNEVGDEGGSSIATALKSNHSLSELFMIDCRIGDAGGKAIGQGLARNKTLQKLGLRQNPISQMTHRFAESTCAQNAQRAARLAQGLPSESDDEW